MTDHIRFETDGAVAIITLDRPDARNAMNAAMSDQMREAVDRFEAAPDLRVAVLRAEGPVFCAGMDLKAFQGGEGEQILFGPGRLGGFVSRQRNKPVIAAVQGPALAGGFEIALACDMIVAHAQARFGLPEPRIGLVAGAGGAFRIGQAVPRHVAHEILLTGAPISAQRAYDLGLVNHLCDDDPLPTARDLAHQIAANAPQSVQRSLRLAAAAASAHEAAIWADSDAALRALMQTQDAAEGAQAFAQKRAPQWCGE